MNKLTPINCLRNNKISNINPKKLGYVHPTGEIGFANQEAAIDYAKNRVVSALNYENGKMPFERGFLIHNNLIISQADGDMDSVIMVVPRKYKYKDFIDVHGHPDATINKVTEFINIIKNLILSSFKKQKSDIKKETNGIAYPISFADYYSLMSNLSEKQSIVYNSKGKVSKLTKIDRVEKFGYSELQNIELKYWNDIDSGYLYRLKKQLKAILIAFLPSQKAEEFAKRDALKRSLEKHNFWEKNAEKLGKVKYETNFFE